MQTKRACVDSTRVQQKRRRRHPLWQHKSSRIVGTKMSKATSLTWGSTSTPKPLPMAGHWRMTTHFLGPFRVHCSTWGGTASPKLLPNSAFTTRAGH
eukprot:1161050-Pelagomonas_calceolata.AAC.7